MVLALAAERPAGPYEMIKVLEKVNIRRWYPISDSSVYLAVKNLHKQGLLDGTPLREGNMPEKTVYSITDKGREVLRRTLMGYFNAEDSKAESLDIAMLFICHLPKEETLGVLDEKIRRLDREIERARNQHRELMRNPHMPFNAKMMVRHNLYEKLAERAVLRDLAEAARKTERWDFFPAKDLG